MQLKQPLMLIALFIVTMVGTAIAPMLNGLTPVAQSADTYTISGSNFLKNNVPITRRGVNAMHVFGGSSGDANMKKWKKINIVREFIGNMRDNPLTGYVSYVNGTYLHPLDKIVNENRANGKITLLCPFGWDGTSATAFLGTTPSQTPWWNDYKSKYRDIANQFKNQPDVWFEVWNEPYWYDRSHGYSDDLWLSDMKAMVDNIRSTGATNIVIVPGAETGQDEKVILAKGKALVEGRTNVGFDVHAYENWLRDSQASVSARIQAVKNAGLAMLFGEVGPHNAAEVMNPNNFLRAAAFKSSTVMAWLWKADGTDYAALLNADGTLNNNNNNNWGSTYQGFTLHSETEGFPVEAKSSGDSYFTITDQNSSAEVFTKLNANAVNDYVTYTVNVPEARTYNVRVGVKKVNTRGRFQLAVNGTNYGSPQDLYAASASYVELDVANITFSSSGNKSFKFTVTGKNASSKGYTLGLDYIKLIPN